MLPPKNKVFLSPAKKQKHTFSFFSLSKKRSISLSRYSLFFLSLFSLSRRERADTLVFLEREPILRFFGERAEEREPKRFFAGENFREKYVERYVERYGERYSERYVERYGEKYVKRYVKRYVEKYSERYWERITEGLSLGKRYSEIIGKMEGATKRDKKGENCKRYIYKIFQKRYNR